MEYQLKTYNNILFLVILGAFIFFVFIMPTLDKKNNIMVNEELLNVDKTEPVKLYDNICSRECCKFSQWTLPPELAEKEISKELSKELSNNYIGSNMSCNGGDKGGCLCFSKENFNFLSQRGGNSISF
jgi:hypothetical protein